MTTENADLLSQLQELQASANLLIQARSSLVSSLDEQKAVAESEARDRVSILGKYRNMEHQVDGLRQQHEEEICSTKNLAFQLDKALSEADTWRQKYQVDGMMKAEELEMARLKLQARLSENLNTIEQLQGKLTQIERNKAKLQEETNEMSANLDQAMIMNNSMEKKAKQYDRVIGDWKIKVDGLGKDLNVAQNEARTISAELFKHKNAYDESCLQLEEVRRENKNLSNEIKDIMDQITEGGRSIHEIDKIRKRLEAEKMELEAALAEAEGALEQEENKVLRLSLELNEVQHQIDLRIAQKEAEFESSKKNFVKALDGMQSSLENESKGKNEALRQKKKLETDVVELGVALEHANAAMSESQRNIQRLQQSIREVQAKLEDEMRAKAVAQDNLISADRRANANKNSLEEARTLLEQSDRTRRMLEQELADTNETLSELTCQNQVIFIHPGFDRIMSFNDCCLNGKFLVVTNS